MTKSKFRGHDIHSIRGVWFFCDTGRKVAETWKDHPCGHCGEKATSEDHDACLGTLPGVMNACCGHGEEKEAYVQFHNGEILRGADAKDFFNNREIDPNRYIN